MTFFIVSNNNGTFPVNSTFRILSSLRSENTTQSIRFFSSLFSDLVFFVPSAFVPHATVFKCVSFFFCPFRCLILSSLSLYGIL